MHTLVQMQHVTRKEFLRGLRDLTAEDAGKRVEPMNSITWVVGHLAHQEHQEHTFFVSWARAADVGPEYFQFATGSPPTQPPLDDVMELWRAASEAADGWLHTATADSMRQVPTHPDALNEGENLGTLITRNIFHYWCHIGEISAIRQMLRNRPPEFVTLHGWAYE